MFFRKPPKLTPKYKSLSRTITKPIEEVSITITMISGRKYTSVTEVEWDSHLMPKSLLDNSPISYINRDLDEPIASITVGWYQTPVGIDFNRKVQRFVNMETGEFSELSTKEIESVSYSPPVDTGRVVELTEYYLEPL